ncbi:putative heat shock transcription factor [Schistosoma mansoni]|nr:putative heat shock transcription factor [Schistosoma mansoni]|eukprot:XP_018654583.1 putative heat shock transcription factor [Schistosoma mansoni]
MYGFTSGPPVQSIPAFLTKLKLLVDDEETNELIYWDPHGTSFHIRDGNRLAKELLPLYFKHNNLSSFIRQLNMYGFRKINRVDPSLPLKSDTEDMEFSHPYFIRNKDILLSKIQRRTSNMFSPIMGSRNQSFGVKVPYVQANSGLNGSISVSPQRPITATDFLRLAETVRHLRCNQETLSQQISVLKSENQLLYRELSDLREHHDKQSQLIQTLFTFLSAFAKEGRSASVCIGQTKRKALPSITPSGSRFQNKELKLDLRKGFQIERNSVQPLQLVQTSDLLGSHKRPKFDIRNLSAKIGNTSSGANITDQISDIGSVVHILPSNLQLTPVSLECDVNTQSLVDKNPVNVQDGPRYYLSKVDDNFTHPTNDEEFPVGLNVEEDGVTDVNNSILELNWPCSRSDTPYCLTDSPGLSDVIPSKLDGVTDESICDLLLNGDSQTEQEVGNNQPFSESTLSKYKKEPIRKQHKIQNRPRCIAPFAESDPQFVSTTLQDIDSLPWEKYQDSGFDFNLDVEQNQTENSRSSSNGLIVGNEIIPVEPANLNACDDVIQFLRSEIPGKKLKSDEPLKTVATTEAHASTQNGAIDLTSSSSAPTTWKARLSANNRLTISSSPKVKRKQVPVLIRRQSITPLSTPDFCEEELE